MQESSETIKVSYIFNDKNYHGAYAQHIWHRSKAWVIARSILCIVAVLIGGLFMMKNPRDPLAFVFVAGGSVGFLRPMIWQMWHERGIRKHPAFGTKMFFTFGDDGVEVGGKKGKYQIKWEDLFELKITKKGVLMYTSKKSFLWIPVKCFKDNELQYVQQKSLTK